MGNIIKQSPNSIRDNLKHFRSHGQKQFLKQALNILDEHNIDLVLADLNMPEMGGIEMIYHMRGNETTKFIPVVIVSTESSTTRIEGLLADGAKDYLHKPFTPEQFKEVMERVIGVKSND